MRLLFVIVIFFLSGQLNAQHLPIERLINKTFGTISAIDTVYYIKNGQQSFVISDPNGSHSKSVVFVKNESNFRNILTHRKVFRLDLDILQVDTAKMIIKLSLNETNKELYEHSPSIYVFSGDWIVECLFINSVWEYSRTLETKRHLTD